MRTHPLLALVIGLGLAEPLSAPLRAQTQTFLPGGAFSSIAPPARFADPERVAKLRAAFPRVDSLMRRFAEERRVPGWAYGIVIDGRLEHVVAGGVRNVERRAATDTATVFRIASMSKSF